MAWNVDVCDFNLIEDEMVRIASLDRDVPSFIDLREPEAVTLLGKICARD